MAVSWPRLAWTLGAASVALVAVGAGFDVANAANDRADPWLPSIAAAALGFGAVGALIAARRPTWVAVTGGDSNPLDSTLPPHPVEWFVTLFVIPLATAVAGFAAWRAARSVRARS